MRGRAAGRAVRGSMVCQGGAVDERTAAHRRTYDVIATAYDSRTQSEQPELLGRALAWLVGQVPAGGLVADLGCGPGRDLELLEAAGYAVVGVDLSEGMLGRAAVRVPGRVAVGDLRRLPLADGCCAGVWSSYALLHLDDDELAAALREVARILVPRGSAALVLATAPGGTEPVAYMPGQTREFFGHNANRIAELACSAGLSVVSCEVAAEQWRAPVALDVIRL